MNGNLNIPMNCREQPPNFLRLKNASLQVRRNIQKKWNWINVKLFIDEILELNQMRQAYAQYFGEFKQWIKRGVYFSIFQFFHGLAIFIAGPCQVGLAPTFLLS